MKTVILTQKLPLPTSDPLLKELHSLARVVTLRKPSDLGRCKELPSAFAVLSFVTDPVGTKIMARAKNLKLISNFGVGYNNIDINAAQTRGITVTNTPNVLTNATAELTIGLIFAAARRFKEGTELLRTGKFKGWEPGMLLGQELEGSRLGIIGMGRIGKAVATKARALGMDVVACRSPLDEILLKTSDFISVHCPLNAQTRHLINAKALAKMKPTAVLINTARGEVVDEKAVLKAIAAGKLAGAAFDVFENEPRINPKLLKSNRIFALPHLGSATGRARTGMAHLAVRSVLDVLVGRTPRHIVT